MDLKILLKALPIFSITSNIVANWPRTQPILDKGVIVAVEDEIDALIFKGHLPPDFKKDIGTLIAYVVRIHPEVPNTP
jgi:hypothetical protein